MRKVGQWASTIDLMDDTLNRVQEGLPVAMIMTPREDLMTCRWDEYIDEVMQRNEQKYSFLPVVEGPNSIVGLFEAQQWFNEEAPHVQIAAEFKPRTEDSQISEDASILEFVISADEKPVRLVVSDGQVTGLVHISDLQQLPVRVALFALVTSLEIAMARRIQSKWPSKADQWINLLSSKRGNKVREDIDKAKQDDVFISEVLLTQFADKTTIIEREMLVAGTKSQIEKRLKPIKGLRDALAHSNSYAEQPEMAEKLSSTVKSITDIMKELVSQISETLESHPQRKHSSLL